MPLRDYLPPPPWDGPPLPLGEAWESMLVYKAITELRASLGDLHGMIAPLFEKMTQYRKLVDPYLTTTEQGELAALHHNIGLLGYSSFTTNSMLYSIQERGLKRQ